MDCFQWPPTCIGAGFLSGDCKGFTQRSQRFNAAIAAKIYVISLGILIKEMTRHCKCLYTLDKGILGV